LLSVLGGVTLAVSLARFFSLRRLRRKFREPLPGAFPYRARIALVTKNELVFYTALRRAAGARFAIAPKVRLADIITCSKGAWCLGYGRLVAQKHIDFVLCDPATLRVLLALEVDDRSHERPERRLRDRFVDEALKAAGIPLVRVCAARSYDSRDIEYLLATVPG
jgi:hypothetical protein